MANDLNQCSFIGRLGRDPEIKYLPSGDPVCSFSIACGWKGKDKEGTEWVNISAFGKLAEIVGQYCKKGGQVFVQGKLTTRKYQGKDGTEKYATQINADRIQLLGGKTSGQPERTEQPAKQEKAPAKIPGGFDDMTDDIPFANPYRSFLQSHVI